MSTCDYILLSMIKSRYQWLLRLSKWMVASYWKLSEIPTLSQPYVYTCVSIFLSSNEALKSGSDAKLMIEK